MRFRKSSIFLTLQFISFFLFQRSGAQTLISYGNHSIGKEEFIRAFNKNNAHSKRTEKAYRDYLDLYTRYKLKVQAAYDMRLDTLPALIAELQNFRNQIADPYMNDEAYVNKLVDEAWARSGKDIHLGQIYVAISKGASPADTLKAHQKIMDAYAALKRGGKFEDIALKYSEDPFAKTNRGDIGYITVFTLPYELENLAYSTPEGKFSAPYRSRNGYHIFKNLGVRKAIGKISVSQILLVFPINANAEAKADVKKRADSMYAALLKGASFSDLAKKFSGDNLSYQNGGQLPEFGVGRYDPAFEKTAFGIMQDGGISKPLLTDFGYHIIKRNYRKPVPAEKTKAYLDLLKQQVLNDARIEKARQAMTRKIFLQTGFAEKSFNENQLWIYTDSSLQNKTLPKFPGLDASTILFSFSRKNMTVADWTAYRNTIRNVYALTRNKTNRELLDQFEQTAGTDYYRSHLEDYNPEFAYQLNEFKDGNLLFEIMQRKVWDKASSDSAGLRQFYDAHKNKYWWEPSADALLFTCSNERSAEDVKQHTLTHPGGWRKIDDQFNGQVQTDSGRFELSQLPAAEQGQLKPGQFSSMTRNGTDNHIALAYILAVYPTRSPRNYEEARGLVVNDYQAYLEDQWIRELKNVYPVKVNEDEFKKLPR